MENTPLEKYYMAVDPSRPWRGPCRTVKSFLNHSTGRSETARARRFHGRARHGHGWQPYQCLQILWM
jgi:hypothetical protein